MPIEQERGHFPDNISGIRQIIGPLLFGVGLVVIVVVILFVGKTSHEKLMEFMAICIEHHSAARCDEFYKYNRRDLGRNT